MLPQVTVLATVLVVLQGLLVLASGVCALLMVGSAFRKDVTQGLLCLFVPLYVVYWAFTRFDHPQRRPILWIMLGGPVVAFALGMVSIFTMMTSLSRPPSPSAPLRAN